MARCPFAVWRPIRENYTQARIDPDIAIAHSAVDAPGPSSLFSFFDSTSVGVETHFFIKNDGVIEQYLDTNVRADANRYVNGRAVSFETEDEGDPNNRKWTPQQVASIKRLLAWLWQVHPRIQKRMCPGPYESGVGYHTMFGAPSAWTPVVKTCPGTVRKVQWAAEIAPWIRGYSTYVPPKPAPAPSPSVPGGMCEVNVRVLRRGSRGGDVKSLQVLLRAKAGQNVAADGDFGPATDAAVRNVQRFFRLAVDGVVGSKTWGALFL